MLALLAVRAVAQGLAYPVVPTSVLVVREPVKDIALLLAQGLAVVPAMVNVLAALVVALLPVRLALDALERALERVLDALVPALVDAPDVPGALDALVPAPAPVTMLVPLPLHLRS